MIARRFNRHSRRNQVLVSALYIGTTEIDRRVHMCRGAPRVRSWRTKLFLVSCIQHQHFFAKLEHDPIAIVTRRIAINHFKTEFVAIESYRAGMSNTCSNGAIPFIEIAIPVASSNCDGARAVSDSPRAFSLCCNSLPQVVSNLKPPFILGPV